MARAKSVDGEERTIIGIAVPVWMVKALDDKCVNKTAIVNKLLLEFLGGPPVKEEVKEQ